MKNIKTISALSALMLALPITSSASDLNPWTECGIGAMIFDETPAAAVISNVIWDLGTTAVTSAGTSENTCEGKSAQTASFIFETYTNIEEETIKGDGQHLHAMLNIMGCEASSHNEIINSVRTSFSDKIQDTSYQGKSSLEKAQDFHNIVEAHASQCKA